jgi:cytidyltransferase-like protein
MIIKYSELEKLQNEKTVFVGGVYDLTHTGHVRFFQEAKRQFPDHKLVVGLVPDKRVKLRKGESRPILNQKERATMVDAIRYVDYVFVFPSLKGGTVYPLKQIFEKLKPDIYFAPLKKRATNQKYLEAHGGKIVINHRTGGLSTTRLIKRVLEKNKTQVVEDK